MAILKCKMCGGDLEIGANTDAVLECEYCGTKQTIPAVDNEKKLNLFNRANRLRINCEFDKAAAIYESVIAEFPEEAEGYWGLLLSNYGIEYVDDPATAKKIPTCHRASFESIMKDENFELALEYSDVMAQKVYRDEAREIDRIREEILSVSKNEPPYDIFICYKENDNGNRTVDSLIAEEVYDALTAAGYRVFFSRISLEDKLGRQYEPYIFAALNSAKVMLAFGTKYEYYHAVWVKNEWSRFLKLSSKGSPKTLIPCYKDMDAYDMPDEFKPLQAQDMGKVGAVKDLLRGIEKLFDGKSSAKPEPAAPAVGNPTVDSLLKRVFLFLEDKDWKSADEYAEKVLDIDPECSEGYIGKLMASLRVTSREDICKISTPLTENNLFAKAKRFSNDDSLDRFVEKNLQHLAELRKERLAEEERKAAERKKLLENLAPLRERARKIRNLVACSTNGCFGLTEEGEIVATENILQSSLTSLNSRRYIGLYNNLYAVAADGGIYNLESPYNFKKVGSCPNLTDLYCNDYCPTFALSNGRVTVIEPAALTKAALNAIPSWKNIVKVCHGLYDKDFAVGLDSEGRVHIAGDLPAKIRQAEEWQGITDIAVGNESIIGLKADGTVVGVGENEHGDLNISDWTDIAAIYAKGNRTFGLKSDGTVVAVGLNNCGEIDLQDWKDIIQLEPCFNITYGLTADGRVLSAGESNYATQRLGFWENVVAINKGDYYGIAAIFDDGTADFLPNTADDAGSKKIDMSSFELFIDADDMDFYKDSEEARNTALEAALKASNFSVIAENRKLQKYKDIFNLTNSHTVAIKADGTAVAAGEKDDYKPGAINVGGWKNLKKIYTSHYATLGVTYDGMVLMEGHYQSYEAAKNWRNIVKLDFGKTPLIAGLKSDGRAICSGTYFDYSAVPEWTDLVDIACTLDNVFGLKKDGTVVSALKSFPETANWTDIVQIACGGEHIIGLKKDGTVVAEGNNNDGQCNVEDWKNVIAVYTTTSEKDTIYSRRSYAITADGKFLSTDIYAKSDRDDIIDMTVWHLDVALIHADGTVSFARGSHYDNFNPAEWYDIVRVCMGHMSIVGLRRDGSCVWAYNSKYYTAGNCDIGSWKILPPPKGAFKDEYFDEFADWKNRGLCRYCGGSFKGLFTKKCTACGREKDY